jgi:hypothetical protein
VHEDLDAALDSVVLDPDAALPDSNRENNRFSIP